MAPLDLSEILAAARRLPRKAQTALAETLLQDAATGETQVLEPLRSMSEVELRVLANAVVAPDHQRRLKALLQKNQQGKLTSGEADELDSLLEESDRIALLKARAAFTLARSGAPSHKAA